MPCAKIMPHARSVPCAKNMPHAIFMPGCNMVESRIRKSPIRNLAKNNAKDIQSTNCSKLLELTNRFKFQFTLRGDPNSGFNIIKLAAFISRNSPAEYTAHSIDGEKTVIFWNP